jgi:hypothetical protein
MIEIGGATLHVFRPERIDWDVSRSAILGDLRKKTLIVKGLESDRGLSIWEPFFACHACQHKVGSSTFSPAPF